ncbi:asparagine synthase C-terminal domain-containing protein [Streptosporangium sp. NBC_01639]|uniref:asparagine synthase-related protein n=1 Tax=Streptosporangium sp. NBC_01639 TaxID=2975948 RepID=UPI00386CB18B|nr:asparagine synthase C-terminal domain-containing protein [Streptosporangium sp. NBC_01639]
MHGEELQARPFRAEKLTAPWSMKTFDGREKSLLRAASADLLPRSVLERRKSPYPSTQDPAYGQALRAEAARLLDQGDVAAAPLIDLEKVRAILDRPTDAGGSRASLERFLQLNAWLEDYGVQIGL